MVLETVRTLKDTLKLKPVLIKFALLLILSIVTACKDAPKFPDVQVFETARNPETKEYLCGEYKITDPKNFKITPVIDHPISMCEGVFGFKTKDFPTVIEWMQSVEKYYQDKLDECRSSK